MLINGSTPKEISYDLNIAYNTVLQHQNKIYRKLDIHNINELLVKYRSSMNNKTIQKDININAIFHNLECYNDSRSKVNIKIANEEINRQIIENCVIISGMLNDHLAPYASVKALPDISTLEDLRSMNSFSFKTFGDGNAYSVMFSTIETEKTEGDHWFYAFPTLKHELMTITVNIPADLIRRGYSGKDINFIQNDIVALYFAPVTTGFFCFKIWDFKVFK